MRPPWPARTSRPTGPRPPSLLDALLPIVVLIGLLALTIGLFGVSATDGPLQVALLLSAAFASLIAFKNGYTVAAVAEAAVGGVTAAMGAVFILLAVGALIGTWNMAGTIPTVVDYGIRLVSPSWFYFTAAAVCALVGMVTGSSWTTAGTLGVAFVGMSNVLGLDEAVAAGAVICGAYFGDKMTPLSETTILVPRLVGGGLTVGQHVRNMVWTAGPALGISLVLFFLLGRAADPDAEISTDAARAALADGVQHLRAQPAAAGPAGRAGGAARCRRSCRSSARRCSPPCSPRSSSGTRWWRSSTTRASATSRPAVKAGYAAMATGFVSDSGVPEIDDLFSRGGMASMLTTIWLVLGALSFAAVMEHAGFLQRLLEPIVSRTRRRGSLIAAVNGSGIGLNVIAGDQYVADVLPARMFRKEFARRGLAPQVLSRAVEDSGTVTSVLVPWNTCGAYIAGVLGVSTAAYFPFCFFNLLSPLLDIVYGFVGFKVPRAETPWEDDAVTATIPAVPAGETHG